MPARIEKIIGPDDIGALLCLIVFSVLTAMTAINWISFWLALEVAQ